jgi:hypothetical protein
LVFVAITTTFCVTSAILRISSKPNQHTLTTMPSAKRARRSQGDSSRVDSPEEKNEEELQLEAALFGTKRKTASVPGSKGKGVDRSQDGHHGMPGVYLDNGAATSSGEDDSEDDDLAEMDDRDVSRRWTIGLLESRQLRTFAL